MNDDKKKKEFARKLKDAVNDPRSKISLPEESPELIQATKLIAEHIDELYKNWDGIFLLQFLGNIFYSWRTRIFKDFYREGSGKSWVPYQVTGLKWVLKHLVEEIEQWEADAMVWTEEKSKENKKGDKP